MNPGLYRRRIEIKQNQEVVDPETRLPKKDWVTFHKCWAAASTVTQKDYYEAAAVHEESTIWFRIRGVDGITSDMVVFFKDKKYEIVNTINDLQYGKEITLMCKEVT